MYFRKYSKKGQQESLSVSHVSRRLKRLTEYFVENNKSYTACRDSLNVGGCIHANLNVEELRYVFFSASLGTAICEQGKEIKQAKETRSDIASLA